MRMRWILVGVLLGAMVAGVAPGAGRVVLGVASVLLLTAALMWMADDARWLRRPADRALAAAASESNAGIGRPVVTKPSPWPPPAGQWQGGHEVPLVITGQGDSRRALYASDLVGHVDAKPAPGQMDLMA